MHNDAPDPSLGYERSGLCLALAHIKTTGTSEWSRSNYKCKSVQEVVMRKIVLSGAVLLGLLLMGSTSLAEAPGKDWWT